MQNIFIFSLRKCIVLFINILLVLTKTSFPSFSCNFDVEGGSKCCVYLLHHLPEYVNIICHIKLIKT